MHGIDRAGGGDGSERVEEEAVEEIAESRAYGGSSGRTGIRSHSTDYFGIPD